MRLALVPALLLTACAAPSADITAEGELTLTAVSAEEEDLRPGFDDFYGAPSSAEADVDQPRIGRECGADGVFNNVMGKYDADGDAALSGDEEQAVWDARADRNERAWKHRAMRWQLLQLVYDGDDDGELSEVERDELLADFTQRCEARHQQLVAEFDADEDGELSDEELAEARVTMELNREERREGCNRGEGMGEDGATRERGHRAERRDPASRLTGAWDGDGDGELSGDELTVLRDTLRARIVTGEAIRPFATQ